MKLEKTYLRVAKKLGYFFLVIILFIAAGGIYQGFMEAHNDNKTSTKEASEKH